MLSSVIFLASTNALAWILLVIDDDIAQHFYENYHVPETHTKGDGSKYAIKQQWGLFSCQLLQTGTECNFELAQVFRNKKALTVKHQFANKAWENFEVLIESHSHIPTKVAWAELTCSKTTDGTGTSYKCQVAGGGDRVPYHVSFCHNITAICAVTMACCTLYNSYYWLMGDPNTGQQICNL